MGFIVRSWNVFHGNTDPPRRRGYLHEMVRRASADRPDVLCLQEVPVWAVPRLDDWSGMRAVVAVTRLPFGPKAVAGWVTRLHQGVLRSAVAGQANAVLVAQSHSLENLGHERISDAGRERRVVQCVRVGRLGVVAHLHATNDVRDPQVPAAELGRARLFAEAAAGPGEPVVLVGDFNFRGPVLPGYSAPGPGIDHILVRGAAAGPLVTWPRDLCVQNGVVLSDHAPVELEVG
ncbi:MAG: endonuclease/exonuclease/phosphatase family protein [Gaiellaceae bacterium]